jgi:uncharacterized protein (DUF3084 family)
MGLHDTFSAIMAELSAIKTGMLSRAQLETEVETLRAELAKVNADRKAISENAEKVSAEFKTACEEKAALETKLTEATAAAEAAKAEAAARVAGVIEHEATLGTKPVPAATKTVDLRGYKQTAATQKIKQ